MERRKQEERIKWREGNGWKRNEGRVTEKNRKKSTSGEGFPNCEILIKRYPANINNNKFSYLDYSDAIERVEIVNMLIRTTNKNNLPHENNFRYKSINLPQENNFRYKSIKV